MINLASKTIVNGYGTVLIGIENFGISVSEVDPAQEIGNIPEGEYTILRKVLIDLTYDGVLSALSMLKTLKETPESFPYKTFRIGAWFVSFEEYNEKSVDVWIDRLKTLLQVNSSSIAC